MADFGLLAHERTIVVIDGVNIYSSSKTIGLTVDYRRLLTHTRASCKFVRGYYGTTLREDDTGAITVKPLADWLSYNGFTVRTVLQHELTDQNGNRRYKGTIFPDLVCDMIEMAMLGKVDHVVLFTGDGDYRRPVEMLKRMGLRVTIVSTTENNIVSDALRREADAFVDLKDVRHLIAKIEPETSVAAAVPVLRAGTPQRAPQAPRPVIAATATKRPINQRPV